MENKTSALPKFDSIDERYVPAMEVPQEAEQSQTEEQPEEQTQEVSQEEINQIILSRLNAVEAALLRIRGAI